MADGRCLPALAREAEAWLVDRALPLWLARGVDRRHGGFHEALDQDGTPAAAPFKRLRVAARQTYVFTEGACRGVPGAREAALHGLAYIRTRMRHPDGGYASRCDIDGRQIDPTRDLYDLAFVLFAFAHAARLGDDSDVHGETLALADFITNAMRHPAGGFIEAIPPRLPRRQNPHMHLLEAALACIEHRPDPRFARLCDELVALYRDRLFDPRSGVLPEYYGDDWHVERPQGRALTEPGHHMEWAWLLAEAERLRGIRIEGAKALAAFALHHGLDPATGLLRGELFEDGTIADPAVRLWPHCEWLKAALVSDGAAGDPVAAWTAIARFLETPLPGLWHERWDPAGGFSPIPSPASTLYHITAAVVALGRHHA